MCFWILLIVLFLIVVGSVPVYPYSRGWGYYPSGGLVLLILILLLLWWFAVLPGWGTYPYWR